MEEERLNNTNTKNTIKQAFGNLLECWVTFQEAEEEEGEEEDDR